jgi:hypothetical protein
MNHRCRKNIKDFFVARVKKNVARPCLSSEELHNVVSEYGDIVLGLQSGKQKFPSFGSTHNWVKRSIFGSFLIERPISYAITLTSCI